MSGLTQWRDCTSYSRDDKERVPTTYEITHGYLRIVITCGHIRYRPNWVLHCFAVGIDTKLMTTGDRRITTTIDNLDDVKARAIEIVEARIKKINIDINAIKEVNGQ